MSDPNEKQQTEDDQTQGNTGNDAGTESTDPGPVPGEDQPTDK
jgi:hypothetical protein